jgi:hypothetical protein
MGIETVMEAQPDPLGPFKKNPLLGSKRLSHHLASFSNKWPKLSNITRETNVLTSHHLSCSG